MLRTTVVILCAFPLACGGLPPAPAQPQDDEAFSRAVDAEPAGINEDPAAALLLLPGDAVTVQLVSAETTDYEGLLVDERGQLHVPMAGDVEVGGQTLTAAEARVREAVSRFDRLVHVNIFLTDPAGHRATVLGAVTTAGRVTVPPGTRLADLLALAGGPLSVVGEGEQVALADLDGARLVRDGQTVPVSLARALEGDPRHNVRVRSGDHLYVPPLRGQRISVLGEVRDAQVVPFRPGIRLTEALSVAGGITIDGDRADIRVVRGSLREPLVYTTSLGEIVDGDAHDVELAPGDVVYVTDHWIASVGEVLDRLGPLLSTGTTFGITAYVIAQ